MSERTYNMAYNLAKKWGFTEEQAIDYAKREANKGGCTYARSVTGKIMTREQVIMEVCKGCYE